MPGTSTAPRDEPLSDLDRAIERMEQLSCGLVLLDELALADVDREVERFGQLLLSHVRPPPWGDKRAGGGDGALARRDHPRFAESVEVLAWLLDIVHRDDHGGNRQALGQYGKILTEALREHRRREHEESELGRSTTPGQP